MIIIYTYYMYFPHTPQFVDDDYHDTLSFLPSLVHQLGAVTALENS